MGLVKLVVRILAVIGKEITEVMRRPGAIVSLILGPFLILAVFGIGYQGIKRDLNAIVVIDPGSKLPTDLATYQGLDVRGVHVIDVTPDEAAAVQRLRAAETDVVIVVPPDPFATVESGKQAELRVIADVSDPVLANYTSFMAETLSGAINREIYRYVAEQGEKYAVSIGGHDLSKVPPDVVAAPTTPVLENLAPVQPTIVGFYGTAALALVLQHLAVTLIALSIVRERASGALDRFRASPMRATELVIGKVLAFGLLGAAIAAVSAWLLVSVLGVPILGSPAMIALVIGLLLVAERQAVQLALLTLLASMFFSGFVLHIEEFQPAVQAGAYLLPVTHGISLLQGEFLTGSIAHPWQLGALVAIAAALLLASWTLLRRELRPE
jgi:ABC-2 type transport system permease protein